MTKKTQETAETTEVVKQGPTEVAAFEGASLSDWGDSEMSGRDIVIPKILLMQSTSEGVTEGDKKMGDIVDSVSMETLGTIDKPIQFIPFHMEKVWTISSRKIGEERFNFEKYEAVTAQNQGYPFTEKVGEFEMKYEYTMQFYVLRPEDISMPYVLSFKSTSSRAGKVLATQMFVRNKAAGLVPPAYTMELGGHKEKNDKGTFAVFDVKSAGKTSPELIQECMVWYKVIKAGKTKVAPEASAPDHAYASENVSF